MTAPRIGEPIYTQEPVLKIDGLPKPGRYRFQLVVLNQREIESEPVEHIVVVKEAVVKEAVVQEAVAEEPAR